MTNAFGSSGNLSAETLALVEAAVAAVAGAQHLVGAGDKNAVDGAAVDAMRGSLLSSAFDGVVVIGEGEKDEAPMLFAGERFGARHDTAPLWDIAVDPIDGTALAAAGVPGAVSVIAASEYGAMALTPEVHYMQKLVTTGVGRGVVDLDLSATENIRLLADALAKPIGDVRVAVIDKPRNAALIAEVQAAGAQWARFAEGDVAQAVLAASVGTEVDLLLGVGGNPEGVASAVAVQVLGGFMQGRLAPQSEFERSAALAAGLDLDRKFELTDLVAGSRHIFVMAGVTDAPMVRGFVHRDGRLQVEVLVLDTVLGAPQVFSLSVKP